MTVFTVGHSTRTLDDFVSLLRAHGVAQLADVRTVPKSRRHPHFAGDALARSLPEAGIAYRHFAALGGLRKPRRDSRNMGWRHESFRGYADHMETPAFQTALDDLLAWSAEGDAESAALRERDVGRLFQGRHAATAIMCAEAVWWRCHRQLIADALVARGVGVWHIMSAVSAPPHALTSFARVDDGRVTYP